MATLSDEFMDFVKRVASRSANYYIRSLMYKKREKKRDKLSNKAKKSFKYLEKKMPHKIKSVDLKSSEKDLFIEMAKKYKVKSYNIKDTVDKDYVMLFYNSDDLYKVSEILRNISLMKEKESLTKDDTLNKESDKFKNFNTEKEQTYEKNDTKKDERNKIYETTFAKEEYKEFDIFAKKQGIQFEVDKISDGKVTVSFDEKYSDNVSAYFKEYAKSNIDERDKQRSSLDDIIKNVQPKIDKIREEQIKHKDHGQYERA